MRRPDLRRLVVATIAVAAAGAIVAPEVIAATPPRAPTFRGCPPRPASVQCTLIQVPLDRTGAVAGTINLYAEKIASPQFRTGALVALAGGPGQAAVPFGEAFAAELAPALQTRDLIVFDQRGTGRSGMLSCPRAQTMPGGDFAEGCAAELGARAHAYTTRDSVDDLEVVRQAAGVDKIAIFGVSYGTKVALAYAARYPHRVEFLVLDSVVQPDGPDAFELSTYAAIPRILRSICDRGGCRGVTRDPVRDLRLLAARLRRGRSSIPMPSAFGPPQLGRMDPPDLLQILVGAVSHDPISGARFPAAVRSALAGDGFALGRLALAAGLTVRGKLFLGNGISRAVNYATLCEETLLPWPRTAPVGRRVDYARTALRRTPSRLFAPFGRPAVTQLVLPRMCLHWPSAPQPPLRAGAPLPDVPTLLIGGAHDALTPLEDAHAVARRLRRATVVSVPGVGHSALSVERVTGGSCVQTALRQFVSDQRVGACAPRGIAATPIAPKSLKQLRPWPGVPGGAGRTLRAALYALEDARLSILSYQLSGKTAALVGLRQGRIGFAGSIAQLFKVVFVGGVAVTGTYDVTAKLGDLAIDGDGAHGRIRIEGSRITGVLGGRRITARN